MKIPLISNYLPDFWHPERQIAVEIKGKALPYDQIKMFHAANCVGLQRVSVVYPNDLPEAVKAAIKNLEQVVRECGCLYDPHEYPRVKSIIVCPILKDSDLNVPSRWRGASGKIGYQLRTLAGINLVGWLNANGIPYAPISQNNFSRLIKKLA